MIKYAKAILPQVSPWEKLFRKELKKCIRWAEPEEWCELRNWCYDNFYELHPEILSEVYNYHKTLQVPVELQKNIKINQHVNIQEKEKNFPGQ